MVAREQGSVFDCATDGSFEALQCREEGAELVCHCVRPDTGMAITGTEETVLDIVDAPDCESRGE